MTFDHYRECFNHIGSAAWHVQRVLGVTEQPQHFPVDVDEAYELGDALELARLAIEALGHCLRRQATAEYGARPALEELGDPMSAVGQLEADARYDQGAAPWPLMARAFPGPTKGATHGEV